MKARSEIENSQTIYHDSSVSNDSEIVSRVVSRRKYMQMDWHSCDGPLSRAMIMMIHVEYMVMGHGKCKNRIRRIDRGVVLEYIIGRVNSRSRLVGISKGTKINK